MIVLYGIGAVLFLWALTTLVGAALDFAWQWYIRRFR